MEVQPTFMSPEINEIATALSEFQAELKQPELSKEVSVKTRTGGTYKFKYADLSTCVKAAAPSLEKHGLAVTQIITKSSSQWRTYYLQSPSLRALVSIISMLVKM